MAAQKKTTTKSPTKQRTVKKAPAKVASRGKVSSSARSNSTQNKSDFMSARFTEQTIFWIVIGVAILFLVTWLLSMVVKTYELYDEIDMTSSSSNNSIQHRQD